MHITSTANGFAIHVDADTSRVALILVAKLSLIAAAAVLAVAFADPSKTPLLPAEDWHGNVASSATR